MYDFKVFVVCILTSLIQISTGSEIGETVSSKTDHGEYEVSSTKKEWYDLKCYICSDLDDSRCDVLDETKVITHLKTNQWQPACMSVVLTYGKDDMEYNVRFGLYFLPNNETYEQTCANLRSKINSRSVDIQQFENIIIPHFSKPTVIHAFNHAVNPQLVQCNICISDRCNTSASLKIQLSTFFILITGILHKIYYSL